MIENKFQQITGVNENACLYKWAWSTLYLQRNSTSSCHRTVGDQIIAENFDDFHNTPLKLETRQKMIEGKWPGQGCEYCQEIEKSGGISDRIDINSRDDRKLIPIEVFKDLKSLRLSPTMIEVYFSNLCNMGCIYCGPGWSSVWETEILKTPSRVHNFLNREAEKLNQTRRDLPIIVDKFFSWLEKNGHKLTNLNVLGGEPFFQPELERLLEFFETNPCPDLKLTIFSNLKVQKSKFHSILDRLESLIENQSLKGLHITASLDCWGPQQEYIRYGLDLNQWEKNFHELCLREQISLEIHGTLTGLTIGTIPELIDKLNYFNSLRSQRIGYTNNYVMNPSCLSPTIFPKAFFDHEFERILSRMQDSYEKETMMGYIKTIDDGEYQPELIITLKEYLDEIDQRRNTDWRKIFPWLEKFKC